MPGSKMISKAQKFFFERRGQIKILFEIFRMAVVWREKRFVKTHHELLQANNDCFPQDIKRVWCAKCVRLPEPFSRQIAVSNLVIKNYCSLPSFKSVFSIPKLSSPASPHSSFSSSLSFLSFASPTPRIREFENRGICLGWVGCFYFGGLFPAICLLHTVGRQCRFK